MSTVIKVENLSKMYRLGTIGSSTIRDDLHRWWSNLRGRGDPLAKVGSGETVDRRLKTLDSGKDGSNSSSSEKSTVYSLQPTVSTPDVLWALNDVSFEVQQGEILGIIGKNGAGKSTLLKILSRVTAPTSGRVKFKGRIASLLEVGTGFHPELTGRENIFLNGAILGMTKAEIARKFDEIVAFSEVEKFIDTPVKRYSSGMYVRLAFAVAAHLEPEILIVDEVLAVGDISFQKKCLGKMGEVAGDGRTVLFVSHNMAAILQLTRKTLFLESGRIKLLSDTEVAVEGYLQHHAVNTIIFDVEHEPREFKGSGLARLIQLRYDRKVAVFRPDEDLCFIARVKTNRQVETMRFSMTVFMADGTPVGSCFGQEFEFVYPKDTCVDCFVSLPRPRLAPGRYYCGLAIGRGNHLTGHSDYDVVLETLHFEIRPQEGESGTLSVWTRNWGPIVLQPLECQVL